MYLPFFFCLVIPEYCVLYCTVSRYADNFCFKMHFYLGIFFYLFCNCFCTGKIFLSYNHNYFTGIFSKKNTLFYGCKASADYIYFSSCKKFTVTSRTICHATSLKFFFSLKSKLSRVSAGCN